MGHEVEVDKDLNLTKLVEFLEKGFTEEYKDLYQHFMIQIENKDMTKNEWIVNDIAELQYKIDFYKRSYNEDLTHKNTDKISIVGAHFLKDIFS